MAVDRGYALGDDVPPCVHRRRGRFRLNQSDLLRFLGDIQWFTATALSKYVTWDAADAHSARAVMSYGGISASMTFMFDDNGGWWRNGRLGIRLTRAR
jgi:hypothetical protein